MSSRKRKGSNKRGGQLWKKLKNRAGQAVAADEGVANPEDVAVAAAPDLAALGFDTTWPQLDSKEVKVSTTDQAILDGLRIVNTNVLASARLQLSLSKKLNRVDALALWERVKERVIDALRHAMGRKFVSSLDDLYALDHEWRKSEVKALLAADEELQREVRKCTDEQEFVTIATRKGGGALNTTKSTLRALLAEIIQALPDLKLLIKAGRVDSNGEEVDDEKVQPIVDPNVLASRIAAVIKARLSEDTACLQLSPAQVDALVAHVSDLRDKLDNGQAPKWLRRKLRMDDGRVIDMRRARSRSREDEEEDA